MSELVASLLERLVLVTETGIHGDVLCHRIALVTRYSVTKHELAKHITYQYSL